MSTHLELTDVGKRIASAQGASERLSAIHTVLLENGYFSALVDKYADRPVPADPVVIDYLEREHGLASSDAEACWAIANENLSDFGFVGESGGKRVILSREHARELLSVGEDAPLTTPGAGVPESRPREDIHEDVAATAALERAASQPRRAGEILPQIAFNIQVVLPDGATPETYDSIFRSMAVHLLGRGES